MNDRGNHQIPNGNSRPSPNLNPNQNLIAALDRAVSEMSRAITTLSKVVSDYKKMPPDREARVIKPRPPNPLEDVPRPQIHNEFGLNFAVKNLPGTVLEHYREECKLDVIESARFYDVDGKPTVMVEIDMVGEVWACSGSFHIAAYILPNQVLRAYSRQQWPHIRETVFFQDGDAAVVEVDFGNLIERWKWVKSDRPGESHWSMTGATKPDEPEYYTTNLPMTGPKADAKWELTGQEELQLLEGEEEGEEEEGSGGTMPLGQASQT